MKWLQVLTCEPIKEILWRGSSQLGTTFDLSTQIGIFTASIDFSQDYYKEKKKKMQRYSHQI